MPGELELVLPDRTRVQVLGEMTIGRAPGSTLQLDDPGVSRRQARISINGNGEGEVTLEDAGSSYGTWLDGERVNGPTPLHDGARIRVGNQELVVERRRDESEAGRTVVVPAAPVALGRLRHAPERASGICAETPRGVRGPAALGAEGPGGEPLPAHV